MIKFLIEKEFKQLLRNKFLPRLIIVFPIMTLLILPLAANYEVKNINLGIIDNSRTPDSEKLVRKIISSGYFRLSDYSENFNDALKQVEMDETDIVLEIPPMFEEDIRNGRSAKLMITANAVSATKAGLGTVYLSGIINDFSNSLNLPAQIITPRLSVNSIKTTPGFKYNPTMEYPVYMVPALLVMLLTQLCGFLPALNIVQEKESGTIEQMNVTPVKKFTFILAKLIPHWVIGFIVLTSGFGVAYLAYGMVPRGSLFTIYLFASIFVLGISGFGLVISNYAKTIQQAMFMMFFFVLSFIFLSGLYTPVTSMPDWAQMISNFSPLKYFIQVMRRVYLTGSTFNEMLLQFYALTAFALVFNIWAVFSYRKTS